MRIIRKDYLVTLQILCATAFVAIVVNNAQGHDLPGIVAERESLEPQVRAKIDEINDLRRLLAARAAATPQDGQLEAVVQTTLRWPDNKADVCFFDGQQQARDHVAGVAQRWTQGTSLQFDFGEPGQRTTCDPASPTNIRVSFRGVGYWSYVGTQALQINPYKQTLNLQGMDRTIFTDDDDGIILHEFGHAIGFEHEHQAPTSGCEEEFNWSYLYTALNWPKDEVDRNMRRLDISSGLTGLLTTTFDRQSIMLYSLNPAAFRDQATAKCYIPQPNDKLSTLDRQAAQAVYPALGGAAPPAAGVPAATPKPGDAAIAAMVNRLRELLQPQRP